MTAEEEVKAGLWLSPSINIIAVLAGCFWVWSQIKALESEIAEHRYAIQTSLLQIEARMHDRFSTSMFIEVQDHLNKKNPTVNWLDAREVRDIQKNHPPYTR